MTTETETQGIFNRAGEIPEDWVAEFNSGHCIIVLPTAAQQERWLHARFALFSTDTGQWAPTEESPSALWGNLNKALAERGYVYSGVWPYRPEVAAQPTPYESAKAIAAYSARLDDLRKAADEEGIEWSENSERDFQAFVTANPGWRRGGRCTYGQRQSARRLG